MDDPNVHGAHWEPMWSDALTGHRIVAPGSDPAVFIMAKVASHHSRLEAAGLVDLATVDYDAVRLRLVDVLSRAHAVSVDGYLTAFGDAERRLGMFELEDEPGPPVAEVWIGPRVTH